MPNVSVAYNRQANRAEQLHLQYLPPILAVVGVILLIKYVTLPTLKQDIVFGIYSVLVTAYILSSFSLAPLYRPQWPRGTLPTITAVIPVKDEEAIISETIARYALSDYPKDYLEVYVVDDGSSDNSWARIEEARAHWNRQHPGLIRADRFPQNRGKRSAMAHAIRRARGDIVVVNDSDSLLAPDALGEIVRPFVDAQIAGVSGHTDVANLHRNPLTKLQAGRYFVAFRVYKSVEALVGSVICLSGSFSAYRRSALMEILDTWEQQTFLGVRCSYGDDRGLTTFLLRKGYHTVYMPTAKAVTHVPETFKKFWRQQLRWKKSWIRETWLASKFMWRHHPLASVRFYVSLFLTALSFVVVARVMFYLPLVHRQLPWLYLGGLGLVALLYGLYYRMHRATRIWTYALLWGFLYSFVLIWQLPWALATLRDQRWGTR